jgi:NNP family nitrate/nitrite transporter-like MFS transporter
MKTAVTNYRMWVLGLTYGFSFGLELTIDNVLAEYYYDQFEVSLNRAGVIASVFGLMNIFTRPCGGILSDAISRRFGMRGRLWILWLLQSGGGMLCIVLGQAVTSLAASVSVVVIFSIFVQAACGATFGIVPFISRRSLGVVSGFVGAGGSVGSVLTQLLILHDDSTNQGFVHIGIMAICCTLPLWLVHFPPWGGMVTCPSRVTEEDYYGAEWTEAEKETGIHLPSLQFAANSWSERGHWFPVEDSVSAHGG